nr:hypothetical protein [Bacteroidales bacterium]
NATINSTHYLADSFPLIMSRFNYLFGLLCLTLVILIYMLMNKFKIYFFFGCMLLSSCLGLEEDASEEGFTYTPTVEIALGQVDFVYEHLAQLPGIVPEGLLPFAFKDSTYADFDIRDYGIAREEITGLNLFFNIENNFPASIDLQFYYVNASDSVIALTIMPITIEAADIDEQGFVVNNRKSVTELSFSDQQLDALYSAKSLIFVMEVSEFIVYPYMINEMAHYGLEIIIMSEISFKLKY